jgi:O-antigen/teichoic acid export membrane protein
LISGLASAAAKAVSVASMLITIPITLQYLGTESFGVWMTLSSFGALMAFTDFGLANGLMNAVAAAGANQDSREVRMLVSTALAVLGTAALLLMAGYALFGGQLRWSEVLSTQSSDLSDREIGAAMAAFAVCLALGMPAAIIQRVQMALQMGYAASLWQLLSSVVVLIATIIVVLLKGQLAWLVVASFGIPIIVSSLNAIFFWGWHRPNERPSYRFVRRGHARQLMRTGFLFFVLQAAASAAFASDNVIIAQLLGPSSVAQYSIVSRLYEGMILLVAVFVTPLWPAYAEAAARGDFAWARQTFIRSMGITAVTMAVVVGSIVVASKAITSAWVGDATDYSLLLFGVYGAWAILKSAGNTLAVFLNGMNLLRSQTVLAVLFAIACVFAKIQLTPILGLTGVPIALSLTYVFIVLLPYALLLRRIIPRG